jgi:hypothetical protein
MKTIAFTCLSMLLAVGLTTSAAAKTSSPNTLKSVLQHYTNIQHALAWDSMENLSANAKALAAEVRADTTRSVPDAVAKEATALAKADDIHQAREAFKHLSASLIACLKTSPAPPGTYYEFYCTTVNASWLQASKPAMNPYLGLRAETPTWGWACPAVEKAEFGSAASSNG